MRVFALAPRLQRLRFLTQDYPLISGGSPPVVPQTPHLRDVPAWFRLKSGSPGAAVGGVFPVGSWHVCSLAIKAQST